MDDLDESTYKTVPPKIWSKNVKPKQGENKEGKLENTIQMILYDGEYKMTPETTNTTNTIMTTFTGKRIINTYLTSLQ